MKFIGFLFLIAILAVAQEGNRTASDKKADHSKASDASAGKGSGGADRSNPNAQTKTKSGHQVSMDDKKETERSSQSDGQKSK